MTCLVKTLSTATQCVPEHVNVVRAARPRQDSSISQAKDGTVKVSVQPPISKGISEMRLYLPVAVDPINKKETALGPPCPTQLAARKNLPVGAKIAVYQRVEVLP